MGRRRLSKSRFVTGLRCERCLWWAVHGPRCEAAGGEVEEDPVQRAVMDRGIRVGELAREYVPGGVLIDAPHDRYELRLRQTRAAVAGRARAIYEAAVKRDNVFVAVDILERVRRGWVLTEVKSSSRVKDEHIPDVAVQMHVLRRAGLDVVRAEVMHLNPGCRYPDLESLFVRSDVSEEVEQVLPEVPRRIAALLDVLDGPLPDAEWGRHCEAPWVCPYLARCWAAVPPSHVSRLYRLGRHRLADFLDRGIESICDLSEHEQLSEVQARQWRAVVEDRVVVEPGLGVALSRIRAPIAFLDFGPAGDGGGLRRVIPMA